MIFSLYCLYTSSWMVGEVPSSYPDVWDFKSQAQFSSGWNHWSWPMGFASKSRALQLNEPRLTFFPNVDLVTNMAVEPAEERKLHGNVVRSFFNAMTIREPTKIYKVYWVWNQQDGDIWWNNYHAVLMRPCLKTRFPMGFRGTQIRRQRHLGALLDLLLWLDHCV